MSNAITYTHTPTFLATTTAPVGDELRATLEAHTRARTTDLLAVAADLVAVAYNDTGRAAELLVEVKARLAPADQQILAREFAQEFDARACSAATQSDAGASNQAGPSKSAASVALDLVQIALSIAGIFDPTPTCDAIDGLVSLLRGDYMGAGISALSMIPYLGDAAKLGKLGKFAQTVGDAVDLAKSSRKFAERVAPALGQIENVLAKVPADSLPIAARGAVTAMRDKLAEVAALFKDVPGTPAVRYRALGAAEDGTDVLPNWLRAGAIFDGVEPPVTVGYSQHIAYGNLNACASGACATAVDILERGHAYPDRAPALFNGVHTRLLELAQKNGVAQPTIKEVEQLMLERGFNATLRQQPALNDLLEASRKGPVVFAVKTATTLDHALVVQSVPVVRDHKLEYLYRLFNPDEFSSIASGLYDAQELKDTVGQTLADYMLTTVQTATRLSS